MNFYALHTQKIELRKKLRGALKLHPLPSGRLASGFKFHSPPSNKARQSRIISNVWGDAKLHAARDIRISATSSGKREVFIISVLAKLAEHKKLLRWGSFLFYYDMCITSFWHVLCFVFYRSEQGKETRGNILYYVSWQGLRSPCPLAALNIS